MTKREEEASGLRTVKKVRDLCAELLSSYQQFLRKDRIDIG